MAISPEDAMKLTGKDYKLISGLEKDIDFFLAQRFDGVGQVDFPFANDLLKLRKAAVDELLNRYRKIGWHVSLDLDQEKGKYVRFLYLKK